MVSGHLLFTRDIAHVERGIEEGLSLISGASMEPLQS